MSFGTWDREEYLAEAKKQLDDKDVYQELRGDVEVQLEKVIKKIIRKLRNRDDISHGTLDYFNVNNSKVGRFYLIPKIHKRLHDVPGRPTISNSGFLRFTYRTCRWKQRLLLQETVILRRRQDFIISSESVY